MRDLGRLGARDPQVIPPEKRDDKYIVILTNRTTDPSKNRRKHTIMIVLSKHVHSLLPLSRS